MADRPDSGRSVPHRKEQRLDIDGLPAETDPRAGPSAASAGRGYRVPRAAPRHPRPSDSRGCRTSLEHDAPRPGPSRAATPERQRAARRASISPLDKSLPSADAPARAARHRESRRALASTRGLRIDLARHEPADRAALPQHRALHVERESLVPLSRQLVRPRRHLAAQDAVGRGDQHAQGVPLRCIGDKAENRRAGRHRCLRPAPARLVDWMRRNSPSPARWRTRKADRRSTKRWVMWSCSSTDSRSSMRRARSCQSAAPSTQSPRWVM